jgi:hypothetical protein
MSAVLSYEFLDERVLGAFGFVDPLGRGVLTPVGVGVVEAGVVLFRKRPGEYVVMAAPKLGGHVAAFEAPPAAPAIGKAPITLDIRPADPALGARRYTLALPRDPDPAKSGTADSLFQPAAIPLLASPAGGLVGLAAAVRVTVTRTDDGRLIEGALVRVRPTGKPEAWGLTDAAGEALVLVPGIPLASPGAGATVVADVGGECDAIVDPALAQFHARADVAAARRAAAQRTTGFPNPDDINAKLKAKATSPAVPLRVAPGGTRFAAIAWTPA